MVEPRLIVIHTLVRTTLSRRAVFHPHRLLGHRPRPTPPPPKHNKDFVKPEVLVERFPNTHP